MRRAALLAATALALPVPAETVTVFAAASLREALEAGAREFEAASGHRVVVSYAATSALARQVEAGAPAQVLISADAAWVDHLEAKGLALPGSRRAVAANELVLVAPAASAARVRLVPGVDLGAALGPKRLAMAHEAVPAGRYGKAALEALGAWEGVRARVAAADNVRAALALVARGEAPLGVVYRTDALAEKAVRIVDVFPPSTHPPIVYPMVLLRGSTPAARAFASHLAGPRGRAAFERHGFRAP